MRGHYRLAIIGPPAKHHLNGVSLACQIWPNIECWLGSRTSIAKKPYIFSAGGGGGGGGGVQTPSPPSGSAYEILPPFHQNTVENDDIKHQAILVVEKKSQFNLFPFTDISCFAATNLRK